MIEVIKKYENARSNPNYMFTRMFLVKEGDCGGIIIRYNKPPYSFSILKFETFMEAVLFVQAALHEGLFKEIDPKSQYWHVMGITQRITEEFRKTKGYKDSRGLHWLFGGVFLSKVSALK